MNVKMTITVPIDEIPKEVDKMLYLLSTRMDLLCKEAHSILQNSNMQDKVFAIDQLRKKMTLLDLNYEDCHSILQGYIRFKSKPIDSEQVNVNNGANSNG